MLAYGKPTRGFEPRPRLGQSNADLRHPCYVSSHPSRRPPGRNQSSRTRGVSTHRTERPAAGVSDQEAGAIEQPLSAAARLRSWSQLTSVISLPV